VPIGRVASKPSEETGLAKDTPVVTGGHDTICGAFGAGVTQKGTLLDCVGTSEGIIVVTDGLNRKLCETDFSTEPHVVKNKYVLLGSIPTSGILLDWFLKKLSPERNESTTKVTERTLRFIEKRISDVSPGSDGLFLLPHFRGSGTPHYDPTSRGAFIGLTTNQTESHFLRATLEGISHELRRNIDELERITTKKVDCIRVVGGGAKSGRLVQLKANITGREIEVSNVIESVTRGAALLAGLGVGFYKDFQDALSAGWDVKEKFRPDSQEAIFYDRCYREVYCNIYETLHSLNKKIYCLFPES
jgi:xylulokinase